MKNIAIEVCKEELLERNKELRCLYKMAELIEKKNTNINEILNNFVNIIPPAMQFPEQTHVILKIGKKTYQSVNFTYSKFKLEYAINTETLQTGTLSVWFGQNILPDNKQALLPEEENLISYLCERIGRVIQRYNLLEELELTKNKLEIQNQMLERKNMALLEVMEQIEKEKVKKEKEILTNIDIFILPILYKMKIDPNPKRYIDILNTSLTEITSAFGSKLRNDFVKLSIKEIEICNLLRNGKTSKEIAEILSVSTQTISKHRDHIRRKLEIKNKKVNLATFLTSLD